MAALVLTAWIARPAPPETIRWQPYTDLAIERARAGGKMVLVDFTASWCAECKELARNTFSDPSVGAAAREFVALRADMTDWGGAASQRLKGRYGIVGLPTVVRLSPISESLAAR